MTLESMTLELDGSPKVVTLLGGGFCMESIDWSEMGPGRVIEVIDSEPSIFARLNTKIDWLEARYNEDF